MKQQDLYLKSCIYSCYILMAFYITSVDCNEMCEKLCLNDEQCLIHCISSVDSHRKSENKGNSNRLERKKSKVFSSVPRQTVKSPYCGLQRNNKNMAPFNASLNGRAIRVVGGNDAEKMEFPWIVSVQRKDFRGDYKHFCAGTILNDYFIMTAAHCAQSYVGRENEIILRLGVNNLRKISGGLTMSVDKAIVHERWNKGQNLNDIALFRTSRPIRYTIDSTTDNFSINSVCLPASQEEPKGNATLSGWGQLGESLPPSNILQKLEVPMYSRNKCVTSYKEYAVVTSNMVCFGGQGGQDSCMGDSGGPLVQAKNDRFVIIGVVSFGIPCALKGFPGVYTQVSKYINWINKNAYVQRN